MPKPAAFHFEPRRALGRTGFVATALGIGNLADRELGIEACVATLRRALDAGLNVIDTAPNYEDGFGEETVGAALRGRPRDEAFVVDKVADVLAPVAPQVEASLGRLGLEYADLFLFHDVSKPEVWERLAAPGGGMDQLEEEIRRGHARFRGISSHSPDVLRACIESGRCDVAMFAVGPHCDARYIDEILPLARERGVGSICFKTFGMGKLLADTTGYGKPLKDRPPDAPPLPRIAVAECVRCTLTHDPDVALLCLSTPEEQDEAFAAAVNFRPLSRKEMADIRRRAAEAVKGKGKCWWNP